MKGLAIRGKILPSLTVEKMNTNARNYIDLVVENRKKFGFYSFLQTKLKIMRHGH